MSKYSKYDLIHALGKQMIQSKEIFNEFRDEQGTLSNEKYDENPGKFEVNDWVVSFCGYLLDELSEKETTVEDIKVLCELEKIHCSMCSLTLDNEKAITSCLCDDYVPCPGAYKRLAIIKVADLVIYGDQE